MKNVVFYSKTKKDTNSPKLIKLIDMLPFKNEFFYYCVDPDPKTKERNKELLYILDVEKVPTLFIQGEKLVGEDAFKWVQGYLMGDSGVGSGGGGMIDPYSQMASGGGMQPGYDMQMGGVGMGGGGYPPQYDQRLQGFQNPGMDMQGMGGGMGGGMGMQVSAMPDMPPMGMQGATRMPMPPGIGSGPFQSSGPQMQGVGTAGSGEMGGFAGGSGGGGEGFANPFIPTDLSGTGAPNMSVQQLLTPVQTKNQDNSNRMDEALKHYAAQRDAMCPAPTQSVQGLPGMQGMGMQQMMQGMQAPMQYQPQMPMMR